MFGIPQEIMNPNQKRVLNTQVFRQYKLHTGVATVGTATHYITMIILVQFFGLNAVFASSAGFLAAASINYALNYNYTFRSKKSHNDAAIKFFCCRNGVYTQRRNNAMVTTDLAFDNLIAQIMASGCVLAWPFFCNRIWTYSLRPMIHENVKYTTERHLPSIVVPMYNGEEVRRKFFKQVISAIQTVDMDIELVFVNDGSRDNTLKLMRDLHKHDPRIAIVNLSRNFGKEIALTAGLTYAGGDAIVVIDTDLQARGSMGRTRS